MRFARSPRATRRRLRRRRRPSAQSQAQHAQVITELAKGEALVSFLEGNGTPAMVERVMVRPPSARIGPITPEERAKIQSNSPVKGKYDVTVDAESAYEQLQKRVGQNAQPGTPGAPQGEGSAGGGILGQIGGFLGGIFGINRKRGTRLTPGQTIAREVTRTVTWPNRRSDRGRFRKIGGRQDGQLGRARDRPRHARRHLAALNAGLLFRHLEAHDCSQA
jgi:hypothetical protein